MDISALIDITAKRQVEGVSNGALDAVPQQVCLDDFLILLVCNHYRSVLKRLYFFFCRLIEILLLEVWLSAHFFGRPDYDSQNVKIRSFLRFID
jgi:hypothetical protein